MKNIWLIFISLSSIRSFAQESAFDKHQESESVKHKIAETFYSSLKLKTLKNGFIFSIDSLLEKDTSVWNRNLSSLNESKSSWGKQNIKIQEQLSLIETKYSASENCNTSDRFKMNWEGACYGFDSNFEIKFLPMCLKYKKNKVPILVFTYRGDKKIFLRKVIFEKMSRISLTTFDD